MVQSHQVSHISLMLSPCYSGASWVVLRHPHQPEAAPLNYESWGIILRCRPEILAQWSIISHFHLRIDESRESAYLVTVIWKIQALTICLMSHGYPSIISSCLPNLFHPLSTASPMEALWQRGWFKFKPHLNVEQLLRAKTCHFWFPTKIWVLKKPYWFKRRHYLVILISSRTPWVSPHWRLGVGEVCLSCLPLPYSLWSPSL